MEREGSPEIAGMVPAGENEIWGFAAQKAAKPQI